MNTPDYGPKDGDFVAYLAELERHQMRTQRPPVVPSPGGRVATPSAPASSAKVGAAALSTSMSSSLSPAAAAGAVRSLPVGLVVIGFLLVIAGFAINGGLILALVGIVMLVQAARTVMKAAAQAGTSGNADATATAQQVAALLSSHVQRSTSPKK